MDNIRNVCKRIEDGRPLIHCITNIVTVNDCANILLAVGASPVMAHHPLEVEEISAKAAALVLNMGAMESYDAMTAAGISAKKNGVPVILDPVGAAGASYRRNKTIELINVVHPDIIRGNLSEVNALARAICFGKCESIAPNQPLGVDASDSEMLDFDLIKSFSRETGVVIVVSGATDYIVDGDKTYEVSGGSAMLKRITGSGCMLSALLGAFYSLDKSVSNIISCLLLVNESASLAEKMTYNEHGGTMTFRMHFIDTISNVSYIKIAK